MFAGEIAGSLFQTSTTIQYIVFLIALFYPHDSEITDNLSKCFPSGVGLIHPELKKPSKCLNIFV